jgi:bifunctional ADP-heptose synthase (sugar kinase/adenylyltransferase)
MRRRIKKTSKFVSEKISIKNIAMRSIKKKKVFVSGCFDMLHSGHVAFLQEAAG